VKDGVSEGKIRRSSLAGWHSTCPVLRFGSPVIVKLARNSLVTARLAKKLLSMSLDRCLGARRVG